MDVFLLEAAFLVVVFFSVAFLTVAFMVEAFFAVVCLVVALFVDFLVVGFFAAGFALVFLFVLAADFFRDCEVRFAFLAGLVGADTSSEDASSMSMSTPKTDDSSSVLSTRPFRDLRAVGG